MEKTSLSNKEDHIKIIVCKMRFFGMPYKGWYAFKPWLWYHFLTITLIYFFTFPFHFHASVSTIFGQTGYILRENSANMRQALCNSSFFIRRVYMSCVSTMVFGCQRLNYNLNETKVGGVLLCVHCTLLTISHILSFISFEHKFKVFILRAAAKLYHEIWLMRA